VHKGLFLFASEIKSILTVPGVPRELDVPALDQTFTFWTTLPGRTMFKNICEIKPGQTLTVCGRELKSRKYWDIPLYPRDAQRDLSLAQMTSEVRICLIDSIRIRLRADVTVGAYLSGGLDSSGIAFPGGSSFQQSGSNIRRYV